MIFKLFLTLILLATASSLVQTYTGTFSGIAPFQQQTFPIPSGYGILNVYFSITYPQYSNLLLFVSFSPITLNLTLQQLSSLIASDDPLLTYMDPMNVIGDSAQIINLYIPNSATTLYIGIFNFDLPEVVTNKIYGLALQYSSNQKYCAACPAGTSTNSYNNPLSCQCTPCPSNTLGGACQYNVTALQGSTTFPLYGGQNKYFRVSSSGSDVQLTVQEMTTTGAVTMYVQYQYESQMLAGKFNTYYSNNQPLQATITTASASITIPASRFNILITFHNYASNLATISVSIPTTPTVSASLAVVFAVIFSVIGVVLLVIVVCKLRKWWIARNTVVINASPAVFANSNNLIDSQIDKYFPIVPATVLVPEDSSNSDVNIRANDSFTRSRDTLLQCSICFDQIKHHDTIRVTYCKHIFHSKCLLQWFHKNPICPNCRQLYDADTTRHMRSSLDRKAKSTPSNLVKAILGENFLEDLKNKAKQPKPTSEPNKLSESKELERAELERSIQEEATVNQLQVAQE